jgi:hypothetical protein
LGSELRLTLGQPELVLTFGSTPLAYTVADLAPFLVSDLAGYTIGQLDQGEGVRLVFQGGEMPLVFGKLTPAGLIENLTDYTVADLAAFTVAQLDTI